MKTWIIVLLILTLLAFLKVGVRILWEKNALLVQLLVWKFRIALVGGEKKKEPGKVPAKEKKKQKPKQQKASSVSADVQTDAPKKKSGLKTFKPWIQAVLEYWRELLGLIGRVLTSPTLDVLRLKICVGGDDPVKGSVNYGRICAVVASVLPVVENTFRIQKRDIWVGCDYERSDMQVQAEAALTIRIYEIFVLVFALLALALKIMLIARNNKKAVHNYESSST